MIYENCDDGEQYLCGGCKERERLVEVPGKPVGKSSRSFGLNTQ